MVAVQGITYTIGIELMLACDLVVAADDCRFSQLEVQRNLMATGGATVRMVERAGYGNAMRDHEARMALEPFVQVDSGKAHEHKGTGLGLYITRLLILPHGGNLKIHGETGKGIMVSPSFPSRWTRSGSEERPLSLASIA